MNYAFCDIETTGLDLVKHGICQIGGFATGEDFETKMGSFVQDANPLTVPGTEIDQRSLDVNGFTRERIGAAQPIDIVVRAFDAWLGTLNEPTLVFHNAQFDAPRLQIAHDRAGLSTKRFRRVLCTISLGFMDARRVHSLASLCEKFGIQNEAAHDALGDATATAEAFHAIMNQRVGRI